MKFLTWSWSAPLSFYFDQYMQYDEESGEWVVVDEDAPNSWPLTARSFVETVEKYHDRIYAIGLHEFGVNADGTIYDYRTSGVPVLTDDGEAINSWVPSSLRYLMDQYPHIKWSIQAVCFNETPVNSLLDNEEYQDTFLWQLRRIVELYQERYPIVGVEMDFEKVGSRSGNGDDPDWIKYRNLLQRVKNEVCIPTNTELRVNLYAMTGDFIPNYYAWHDYKTIASARDVNGNEAIDEYQLMTYDFTWAGSAPGPSTPVWWLRQVLDHVKESLPTDKVYVGNAAYGRRWPLHSREWGRIVNYKQLMQWQNGQFKHNAGARDEEGNFIWFNQSFVPINGFNDDESGYQVTYPHVYDRFKVDYIERLRFDSVHHTNLGTYREDRFLTSYSKRQKPRFHGIQVVLNQPDEQEGRSEVTNTITLPDSVGSSVSFYGIINRGPRYHYDEELQACVIGIGDEEGKARYRFNLTGTYKLVMIAGFPAYGYDKFDIELNGQDISIDGERDFREWYPFYVLSHHFIDMGEFDFIGENEIIVRQTNLGVCYGFIVCEEFAENFTGGYINIPTNCQPMLKRGGVKDGKTTKVEAIYPDKFILTAEILRRPPRPAIIWEDIFVGYQGVSSLLATPYYVEMETGVRDNGPNYVDGECVGEPYDRGLSRGHWTVDANEDAVAHAENGVAELVVNRMFSTNIQLEAEIEVPTGYTNAVYGLRFLSYRWGRPGNGYLYVFDRNQMQLRLIYESNGNREIIATATPSEQLAGNLGGRYTFRVQVIEGKVYCYVGDRLYIDTDLPYSIGSGGYGVYAENCVLRCGRYSIQSLDRWEPMEKIAVEVDGEVHEFGEVARSVDYDEYGYLVYTGIDISETEEEAPDYGDEDPGDEPIEGSPEFNLDYVNWPVAQVDSWQGRKDVKLHFVDAGVWLRNFYVGDAEGFSVIWNGDRNAFTITAKIINEYGCKGIGMWTLGQEDPTVFTYLPLPR